MSNGITRHAIDSADNDHKPQRLTVMNELSCLPAINQVVT